jgi:PAS domain S-box-containing protein
MLEDNKADAELIRYELRKGNIDFSFELVETEEDFKHALLTSSPDIILSDYELPTFNGISALLVVQSICPQVPFIFVTGVMGEETAIEMLRRGATDYVLKHRLSRLVPAVERAFDELEERSSREIAESARRESEERYRTIFESTATANCIIESDAKISFINDEFVRLTQYSASEATGGPAFIDLLSLEEVQKQDFQKHCLAVFEQGDGDPVRFESRIRNKTGNDLDVVINMGLLPNGDQIVVSLTDMTREKQYEEELKERAERLGDFLIVASHELRHPITVIKSYTATLKEHREKITEEIVSDIYHIMDDAADRLTQTVDKLMDISVIDNQGLLLERQPADLQPLCLEAAWKVNSRGFENRFEIKIADDARQAEVDSKMFFELVFLLLENACVHSGQPSPVEIDLSRRNGVVLVSVLDRGPGIPEADRERIFDRFYQVEEPMHHSQPGLGLGLYIARKIVTAHGGRIWCDPREDGGSDFRFTIE